MRMVTEAVEKDALIALAHTDSRRLTEGGVRPIAGAGRPIVLDTRSDGTMLILIEALGKVHLYPRGFRTVADELCQAEWIDEYNALERENIFLLNRVEKEFIKWLEANVTDRLQLKVFLSQLQSPFEKINYFTSLMIHDSETQQRLLEIDDINERLREISLLLEHRTEYLSL